VAVNLYANVRKEQAWIEPGKKVPFSIYGLLEGLFWASWFRGLFFLRFQHDGRGGLQLVAAIIFPALGLSDEEKQKQLKHYH